MLASGPTRSSVVLKSGLQVDLRVVPPESYGAALHYFTGSKAHNIAIRRLAQERGLKLNEYGVFRGERRSPGRPRNRSSRPSACRTLRPSCARTAARSRRRAPVACRAWSSFPILRGDLHSHTRWTDGERDSVGKWRWRRRRAGPRLSRHHRSLAPADGRGVWIPRWLRKQMDEIGDAEGSRFRRC